MAETPKLSTKQVSFLRSKAQRLEPHLKLGKHGESDTFKKELELALTRHELVKVRMGKLVEVDVDALATTMGAAVVTRLGNVAVLYRPAATPKLELPTE
jgi:RNA-binding protein